MASEFKKTEAFIRKYGASVENEIESRLSGHGKIASGRLYDSIRHEVKENKGAFILNFFMAPYGKYVDKGVTGAGIPEGFGGKKKQVNRGLYKFGSKMPPEKSIKNWMQIKGIPKEASYPIRRSIWIFGIAPTNFFTIPTTRRQKQFEQGIAKNMALDVEQILAKEAKKK